MSRVRKQNESERQETQTYSEQDLYSQGVERFPGAIPLMVKKEGNQIDSYLGDDESSSHFRRFYSGPLKGFLEKCAKELL